MKKYYNKTTTAHTRQYQKIRQALYLFATKQQGLILTHSREINTTANIKDFTLCSYASGKITTMTEHKARVIAKHNAATMPLNATNTYKFTVGGTGLLLKALRFNPNIRTHVPGKKNKVRT